MAIEWNDKTPRNVKETPGSGRGLPSGSRGTWTGLPGRAVRSREVIFFTSQLSLMVEIGTPLPQSLKAIRDQTHNPVFRKVIGTMLRDIEDGRQLSDAVQGHPRVFPRVYFSMLKAGETGGFLKSVLDRIVEIQEKRQALFSQLRSTLTYPMVLTVLTILVVGFILVSVLPKFTVFFAGKEHILPYNTRLLIHLSAFLRDYWWACIALGAAAAAGGALWWRSETCRALVDHIAVKAPLAANISNKIYTCQLLRTLGHLMESRVPLLEALDATRATVGNRFFQEFIDRIKEHVEQGGRFAHLFATYPYVQESVKQMIHTGEETGSLPRVMLRLAQFYDGEVDRSLRSLASMLEPLALLVLGGVVGFVVLSVILPMFRMARVMQ